MTEVNTQRKRRKNRARRKIGKGTKDRPRLSVFRSNKHIYAQLIDDESKETLVSASSMDIDKDQPKKEAANKVGKLIATKAQDKGITKTVFDKGAYKYHGRVKALAEGAREKGLTF